MKRQRCMLQVSPHLVRENKPSAALQNISENLQNFFFVPTKSIALITSYSLYVRLMYYYQMKVYVILIKRIIEQVFIVLINKRKNKMKNLVVPQ
jgi:uncharacterized membrane protein